MTTSTQTITAATSIYIVRHHDSSGDVAPDADMVYGDAQIAHFTREAAQAVAAELASDRCWGADDDKTAEEVGITYYVDAVDAEDIWSGPRREHIAARAIGVPLLEDGTYHDG